MSSSHDSPQVPRDPAQAHVAEIARYKAALADAEREVAVRRAVSEALTAWSSLQQGSARLLRDLAEALGLTAGALWLPRGEVLRARVIWSAPSIDGAALERSLRQLQLPRGVSLAGRAWERRRPIGGPISAARDCFPGCQVDLGGLCATVALPGLAGEDVLGVIELYSQTQTELSERLMGMLGEVGHELGALFARRRGELGASPLTERELAVLTLAANGLAGRRIAERLKISPSTVKTHLEHTYAKLGVSDRSSAVACALRAGLIE
jgi:DNA-binding CsgD family transcriptional regulator